MNFAIRWDAAMGCYRVNVPNLGDDGEPVHVVTRDEHDRLQARALAVEAALLELTHVHHTCLAPSRLHDPRNGNTWADCPCRTCQRTASLLLDAASDWRRCECRARYGVDADGTRPALALCPNARECAARIAVEPTPAES